jgi:hypothetical protein
MYSLLDFTGAVIYFILNIILFPLFILVHALILSWVLQKMVIEFSHKLAMKFRHTTTRELEVKGYSFLRSKNIEALH